MNLAHLEDWSRTQVVALLTFQMVFVCVGGAVMLGRFVTAVVVAAAFTAFLVALGSLTRDL